MEDKVDHDKSGGIMGDVSPRDSGESGGEAMNREEGLGGIKEEEKGVIQEIIGSGRSTSGGMSMMG